MLIEKYQRQLEEDRRYRVIRGIKRDRFFEARNWPDQRGPQHTGEPQRRMVQHSTDCEPSIRQDPRFADRSGSGNPDHRVDRPDVLHDVEESSRSLEQTTEHVVVVGSCPCKVSSEIHITGRRVSEPVQKDKGKATVPKSEDEKDPKRACMVLSKGHEVVKLGYSRLSEDATRAADRGEESGNLSWVHWEYDMDQQIDRVTRDSRGNWDEYSGRRRDWVTQDSWGN
jgi:hypothetical protein